MVGMVRTLVKVFQTVARLRQAVTTVGHETELHNLCAKLDQIEDCVQEVGIMFGGIQFLQAITAAATLFRRYDISVEQMRGRYQIELQAKVEYALQNAQEALKELDKEEVARLLNAPRRGPSRLLAILRKNLKSLVRKLSTLVTVPAEEVR